MIELFIYLCDVLPTASVLMIRISMLYVLIGSFAVCTFSDINGLNTKEMWGSYIGKKLKIFIPMFWIGVLIPSEKAIYLIAGAHYLKESQIPSKVEKVINKKLDEYLNKMEAVK